MIEEVPILDNEAIFYVKETSNTQPLWSIALKEIKPHYIIMDDIYPESWKAGKILSKTVEWWYKESGGRNKVLAMYYDQTKNKTKIDRLKKVVEFLTKYQPRDNNLEMLNEESPWIAIWVSEVEVTRLLLRTRTVMTTDRGDLVLFRPISNK